MKKKITVVKAVIMDEKGRILCMKRIDARMPENNGKWDWPGGKLDAGEDDLQKTLLRECWEEIGCEVEIISHFATNYWTSKEVVKGGGLKNMPVAIFNYFSCRIVKGDPRILEPDKASEIVWIEKDAIDPNAVCPAFRPVIAKLKSL